MQVCVFSRLYTTCTSGIYPQEQTCQVKVWHQRGTISLGRGDPLPLPPPPNPTCPSPPSRTPGDLQWGRANRNRSWSLSRSTVHQPTSSSPLFSVRNTFTHQSACPQQGLWGWTPLQSGRVQPATPGQRSGTPHLCRRFGWWSHGGWCHTPWQRGWRLQGQRP